MKKMMVAVATSALMAAPAFAGTMTISFASDSGETQVWSFDDATGTASSGDLSAPYTWNGEEKTICATTPQGDICATFEEASDTPAVNDSSRYTTNTGTSGTATITAMTE
jgi:hypothetical protein